MASKRAPSRRCMTHSRTRTSLSVWTGAVFMAMEDSWLGNTMKERKVKRALNERIKDSEKADEVFDLVKHQKEYRT